MGGITTNSIEETLEVARSFAKELTRNSVVCFFGDLGAGKTTFIKGVVMELTGCDADDVVSPTFVYLNIYDGPTPVYHFDLYRLKDPEEFLAAGFEEYLHAGGVCCVEWSERIQELLPKERFHVEMSHVNEGSRKITISPPRKGNAGISI